MNNERDTLSLRHSAFDRKRIQAIVNKFWALSFPSEKAPKISDYESFVNLVPEMGKEQYIALSEKVFANHKDVPLIIGGSSGTSGQSKLVIEKTNTPGSKPSEDDVQLITELRMAGVLGPGDIAANLFMVGMYSILHHGFNRIIEACYASVLPLGMLNPEQTDTQLAFMKKHKVNVLTGTPGTLIQVAHAVQASGVDLKIERILYTGERLGEAKAKVLRAVFPGVRIIGFYGLSECGFMAIEEQGEKYKVRQNAYFLEINDAGRLLVTCLNDELPMPFLRFDTGDAVSLTARGDQVIMAGIDRSDTSFNFVGNLVDVRELRQIAAAAIGESDIIIEALLDTNQQGQDLLTIRVLSHMLSKEDEVVIADALLSYEEVKEALDKNTGIVTVEFDTPQSATLTGRNKHRQILDKRA
ncbi:AMP-binding protein [Pseudoalteromonas phenolica]|uniref:Preprotein translocase subunit Tim44 n=1 Tax=Pseudoalteromonas phenolica TaxID=161398 RepID=A0A0S2K5P0_9GAMM|nr:AMP-binding protein [Pseudoalteromonas phenolica]ALO43815.1 preprotein translocase subunit Tim44 [Pseudoalteromonas phenolica]MBE0355007.1 indoleacetate---lysine synthetase [Pseudoalteromonas phenolica O-BC30]RXE95546.1 preprotein translocase subunit Tim44 [Pseudoalteromonas phenolica O-BC30]